MIKLLVLNQETNSLHYHYCFSEVEASYQLSGISHSQFTNSRDPPSSVICVFQSSIPELLFSSN